MSNLINQQTGQAAGSAAYTAGNSQGIGGLQSVFDSQAGQAAGQAAYNSAASAGRRSRKWTYYYA